MKKRMSKVLSGLIILTMIISSTGLAFADKVDKSNETSKTELKSEMAVKAVDALKAKQNNERIFTPKKATEGNKFIVTTIKKGTDVEFEAAGNKISEIYYNTSDDIIPGGEEGYSFCGYSQAVRLNKGTIIMAGAIAGNNGESYANFGLFYDESMDKPVDGYLDIKNTDAPAAAVFSVPKTGTYYLGAYSCIQASSSTEYCFLASVLYMSGLDRTVYSGSQIAVGQTKAQTNYFKFTATKTGYIRVNLTDIKGKIKLCNYNKSKSLSNTSSATQSIVYGVKKGSTYYIKVSAPVNEDIGGYTFKVINYGITENSGSTQSKAKTIYRGLSKAKNGNIIAGYSTSDWYKFTLSSSKAVNIVMKGATNNGIKIAVYKGSKLIKSTTFGRTNESVMIKSIGKWTKGTYYIKISRANSYSSGYYNCYWYYR